MAKLFSFASWNVEHFKNDANRIRENCQFVQGSDPDVFAIYEVEGKDVFDSFVGLMPSHNFFITEDLSKMETLVGVRHGLTAFVTQRQAFKSKVPTLRPGSLVTLTINGDHYSLLFLHVKSLTDPRSWGLRDDMIGHAINLKKALDNRVSTANGANFVCLGDFNTMGMNVTYSDKDMDGPEELERYRKRFEPRKTRLLSKTHGQTWWGGGSTGPSNLDHVFASNHLNLKQFSGADISVRGWPELSTTNQKKSWIRKHSDHALLYGEVHT